MAQVKITDLPNALPLTGNESVPIVQNGVTVQTTTGSISIQPSQTQTFLTATQQPSLANSRYVTAGSGLDIVDNGAGSYFQVNLTGAALSLDSSGTGIQVKTDSTTLVPRAIAVAAGLVVSNGSGVSGNPTIGLGSFLSDFVSFSGASGIVGLNGGTFSALSILGTVGQIAVANGSGSTGNPTISLVSTGVTAGSYSSANITVDTYGRITSATSGAGSYVTSFSAGTTGLTPSTATTGGVILDGVLNASHGGTGANTLTGYVKGNGTSAMTAASTIPTTDLSGTISNAQLANSTISGVSLGSNLSALTIGTGLSGTSYNGSTPTTVSITNLGSANGVATLDAGGTVPLSQIPASIQGGVSYQGTWNATTNSPTLTSSVGTKGYYYVVSVAGSTNLNGITTWNIGDWAIFNGTIWEKIDNTDAVTSVNGYTGTVVLTAADIGGLGTMAVQNANSVAITGGTIDGTTIGGTTPAAGTFTTLTATGQTSLGGVANSESLRVVTPSSAPNAYVKVFGSPFGFGYITTDGSAASSGLLLSSKGGAEVSTYTNNFSQKQFSVTHTNSAVNFVNVTGNSTTNAPVISTQGSDTNVGFVLSTKGTGRFDFFTNNVSQLQFRVDHTASAVNYVQVTGGAAGARPNISIQGSDTNIDMLLTPKGAGVVKAYGGLYVNEAGAAASGQRLQITTSSAGAVINQADNSPISFKVFNVNALDLPYSTASAVNYFQIYNSPTGNAIWLRANGTDSNVSVALQSRGSGAIDLAAGSSGMNISNGGTVTAITLTNNGGGSGGYSSFPSITISPPTTAGGVQATATVLVMQPITASIQSGGSGYTLNDIVSWVGGTPQTIAATFRVSGVSGGVVTAVTAVNFAPYLVLPTTPVSTTGGTGTGLTLTGLFYAVGGTFTITNAGSGYVEQPTVTFSGGGGSGAAAYATVGGATTIRGLGSATAGNISDSILFRTPSGTSFSVGERAATTVNYFTAIGNGSGGQAILRAIGSDTNVSATIGSQGTGSVQFHTNTTSGNLQMQVSHTASAVNYVQVTGAAATGAPTFSGQGSDTNISLQYVAKGTGIHVFQSGTSFNQFVVAATNSSVNYVQVTGAATGGRPTISAQGSDTNVGMVYNTKGAQNHVFSTNAGNLQFVVANRASTVNWAQVIGATAGFGPAYTVEGSDTNIPVILQPKGSGGLQAQQTDATTTGGNARGGRAVDWQTLRSAASQVASGFVATASGGYNNTVSGGVSVVGGGTQNTAAADLSSILGGIANSTPSSGAGNTYSFIGAGYQNNASGVFNVIGGGYLNSGTATAAVTTQSGTMNGTTAVTLSGSNASIKVGQLVTGTSIQGFPNTYVAAISGTSLTLSQVASGSSTSTLSFFTPHGVVVGGGNNQATGSYSFIGGGGDAGTAAFRNQASGDWSVVVGGIQNSATNTYASVLGGANTSATGAYSVSLGGAGNSSSGFGSTNLGGNGNVANGTYAVAGGYSSTNRSIATFAFAAGNASRNGDAQAEMFVLRNITTDATPAVLTTNAAAAGTTTQVILPNNAAYHFKGSVIANVTGAANGAAWEFSGAIMRGANAASTVLINTPSINRIAASSGATAWTIALTADTTNGGLAVTVTGAASTTIRWVSSISTTEVTF